MVTIRLAALKNARFTTSQFLIRAKLAMLVTLSVLVSLTQLPAAEKSVCV